MCQNLTEVTIPDSVTSIGESAFTNSGLTEINIPNSVESIGADAFKYSDLTEITIPNSVKSIGASAFSGCDGLTEINIPESVKLINSNAFSYCSNLSKVTIRNPKCSLSKSGIPKSATIYGYEDSTAQIYAEDNGNEFIILDSSISGIKGDANGDGTVDVADVVAVSAYVADSSKNSLDEQFIKNADVHNTGDGLTANDALMIQQYLSGTIEKF
mgnify:FL=1